MQSFLLDSLSLEDDAQSSSKSTPPPHTTPFQFNTTPFQFNFAKVLNDKKSANTFLPLPDRIGMHTCIVCDVPTAACCPLCSQVSYCCRDHMEQDWPNHGWICQGGRSASSQLKAEPIEVQSGVPARQSAISLSQSVPSHPVEKETDTTGKALTVTGNQADNNPVAHLLPHITNLALDKFRLCPGPTYTVDAYFLPANVANPVLVRVKMRDILDMHGMSVTVHVEQQDFVSFIGEPPYSSWVINYRGGSPRCLVFIFPDPGSSKSSPVNRSAATFIDPLHRVHQEQRWRVGNTLVLIKPSLEAQSVFMRFNEVTKEWLRKGINFVSDDSFD